MVSGIGAALYQQADAMLSRSADTFSRAGAGDQSGDPTSPPDLPGAAVDTVTAKTLGALGGALIDVERRLDGALLDLFA